MKLRSICLPLLLVASCGLPGFQTGTSLTKRHRDSHIAPKDHIVLLNIAANKPASSTPPRPVILQLSDHGQAAFVEAAVKDPTKLASSLGQTFPSPAPSTASRTQVRTTLILTHSINPEARLTRKLSHLEARRPSEADRIAALEIELEHTGPVAFDGFNRFTTVYGEVALGEVTQTSSRTFNASLSPTLTGSVTGAATAGGTSGSSTEEKVVLKERIVQVSGYLEKDKGVIVLEGGVGLDLVGNTSVDVVLELDGIEVRMVQLKGLFLNGAVQDPSKVSLQFIETKIPLEGAAKDISVRAVSRYRFRHVRDGIETVAESDDHVVEYRGRSEWKDAIVLPQEELRKRSRYFVIENKEDEKSTLLYLERLGERIPLNFGTENEAVEFLLWLKARTANTASVGQSGGNPSDAPATGITLGQPPNAWALKLGPEDLTASTIDTLAFRAHFVLNPDSESSGESSEWNEEMERQQKEADDAKRVNAVPAF